MEHILTKPYSTKQQLQYSFLSMKVQLDKKELYLTFCDIKNNQMLTHLLPKAK